MKDLPHIRPIWPVEKRKPFDDPESIFDLKYDGDRGIVRFDGRDLDFISKKEKAPPYPWLKKSLMRCLQGRLQNVIFDGEVVCLGENDWPVFADLRENKRYKRPLTYIAFDLLWLDGQDLRRLPLSKRREMLYELVENKVGNCIRPVLSSVKDGEKIFEMIRNLDLEGMVAKKLASIYDPPRTKWIKVLNREYSQRDKSKWFRH